MKKELQLLKDELIKLKKILIDNWRFKEDSTLSSDMKIVDMLPIINKWECESILIEKIYKVALRVLHINNYSYNEKLFNV